MESDAVAIPGVAEEMEATMTAERSYRYRVVDVFTDQPLEGNSLDVFPQASGLDDATMQRIARELHLSETSFVFPATRADSMADVRIFTPTKVMDFAGHPTIGTSFVLLDEGVVGAGVSHFILQEKLGPIAIRVERGGARPLIWLRTPPIEYGEIYDRTACAAMLRIDVSDLLEVPPQLLSAGNPTIFVAVKDESIVDRALLDAQDLRSLIGSDSDPLCVFIFAPTRAGAYSRMFAPLYGIAEDPATGSSTGPLVSYMIRNGLSFGNAGGEFISEQGTKMGRRSVLHVCLHGQDGRMGIDVGGYVTPLSDATMRFPVSTASRQRAETAMLIRRGLDDPPF